MKVSMEKIFCFNITKFREIEFNFPLKSQNSIFRILEFFPDYEARETWWVVDSDTGMRAGNRALESPAVIPQGSQATSRRQPRLPDPYTFVYPILSCDRIMDYQIAIQNTNSSPSNFEKIKPT